MKRPMTSQMTKRYQVMMGKPGHQQEAEDHAERGDHGPAGDDETAAAFRLANAQDNDADRDQDEGEECADVGKVGEGADVEKAGRNGDQDARDPGGKRRRAEERMDVGEDLGQQAVAGHGEPDARLADLVDENRRDHAHEGAQQDHQANPIERVPAGQKRELLERVDYGRRVADHRLPWH